MKLKEFNKLTHKKNIVHVHIENEEQLSNINRMMSDSLLLDAVNECLLNGLGVLQDAPAIEDMLRDSKSYTFDDAYRDRKANSKNTGTFVSFLMEFGSIKKELDDRVKAIAKRIDYIAYIAAFYSNNKYLVEDGGLVIFYRDKAIIRTQIQKFSMQSDQGSQLYLKHLNRLLLEPNLS
jgi:hypothetical protein